MDGPGAEHETLVAHAQRLMSDDGSLIDDALARRGETVAGAILALSHGVPRLAAEQAVSHALALRGLLTAREDGDHA